MPEALEMMHISALGFAAAENRAGKVPDHGSPRPWGR